MTPDKLKEYLDVLIGDRYHYVKSIDVLVYVDDVGVQPHIKIEFSDKETPQ